MHLFVVGDAVVDVAGSSLFVRCTGAHWRPQTVAHVAYGAPGARPGVGCTVRLPAVVAEVTTSAGATVCQQCDRWSVPAGSAELYYYA